ncbi:unnamed protein product [Chrysodeixis includens]|uniref:Uncharacterized protein n=1 Tax=Chrysodeixis includens TaxID=689277 RepID=A0A9N8KYD0_CHRIL|nr:unnamed protein product [Chrysodeixis includens]
MRALRHRSAEPYRRYWVVSTDAAASWRAVSADSVTRTSNTRNPHLVQRHSIHLQITRDLVQPTAHAGPGRGNPIKCLVAASVGQRARHATDMQPADATAGRSVRSCYCCNTSVLLAYCSITRQLR